MTKEDKQAERIERLAVMLSEAVDVGDACPACMVDCLHEALGAEGLRLAEDKNHAVPPTDTDDVPMVKAFVTKVPLDAGADFLEQVFGPAFAKPDSDDERDGSHDEQVSDRFDRYREIVFDAHSLIGMLQNMALEHGDWQAYKYCRNALQALYELRRSAGHRGCGRLAPGRDHAIGC